MDTWISGSMYLHQSPALPADILASRFCQGQTERGLSFQTFYGNDWFENTEKKFSEWAVRVFGGKSYLPPLFATLTHPTKEDDTPRRKMFTLPPDPTSKPIPEASSEIPSGKAPSSGIPSSEALSSTQPSPSQHSSTLAAPSEKSVSRPVVSRKGKSRSVVPRISEEPSPQSSTPGESAYTKTTSVPDLPQDTPTSAPTSPALDGAIDPPPVITSKISGVVGPSQLVNPYQPLPAPSQVPDEVVVTQPGSTVTPILPQSTTNILNVTTADTGPKPSQVAVNPSQPLPAPSQVPDEVVVTQPGPTVPPIPPQSTANIFNVTTADPGPKAQYRVHNPATTVSGVPSRRGSIDGAPDMDVDLHTNSQIPSHQDSIDDEVVVDLSDYISAVSDTDDETHVSSSQKSSDGCQDLLSPPPSSQLRHSGFKKGEEVRTRSKPASTHARSDVDEEDLPTWMVKKEQWKYIASTTGGSTWENLLKIYMQQERRLEFTDRVSDFAFSASHLALMIYRAQISRTRIGRPRLKNTSSMPTNLREVILLQFLILVPRWLDGGRESSRTGAALNRTPLRARRRGPISFLAGLRERSCSSCASRGGTAHTHVTWRRKRMPVGSRPRLLELRPTSTTFWITMSSG